MAVYKLFPEKDATLYSEYPVMNTGIDQILEANAYQNVAGAYHASRYLVKFATANILETIQTLASGSALDTYLKLYTAKSTGLNQQVLLEINPISGSWNNGTGKYLDNPQTVNGVSWTYTDLSGSTPWATAGFDFNVTASFPSNIAGGGCWYTATSLGDPLTVTASFEYRTTTDITVKVTDTVLNWFSGSIPNEGFILRQSTDTEFLEEPGKNIELKYFSVDTSTIYPPQLEIRWDDFIRETGSLTEVTTAETVVTLSNNSDNYNPDTVKKFRLNVRPQYPTQVFTTSSIYTTNHILPEQTYWSIQDLYTNETVIDFDTVYTKVSCDSNGNYFTVYMNGLEPERYYKILVKTTINGSTAILDNEQYFKVINS
jgi:hypothetical protein